MNDSAREVPHGQATIENGAAQRATSREGWRERYVTRTCHTRMTQPRPSQEQKIRCRPAIRAQQASEAMAPSRSCPGGTAGPPWAELRHPAQHGGSLRPTAGAAHLPGDVCAVAHSPLAPSWLARSGRPGRRHAASPGVGGPLNCGLVWRPTDRARDDLELRVAHAASPSSRRPFGFADAPPTGLVTAPSWETTRSHP